MLNSFKNVVLFSFDYILNNSPFYWMLYWIKPMTMYSIVYYVDVSNMMVKFIFGNEPVDRYKMTTTIKNFNESILFIPTTLCLNILLREISFSK